MRSYGPSSGVSLPSPYIDLRIWARLGKLADAAGSGPAISWWALRDLADGQEQHLAAIDAGIAETDAGDLVGYDEVKADIARKLAWLSARR